MPAMRIHTKLRGRCGHQLSKPDRACRAARSWSIGAFDLDIGLEEGLPFRHRQTRAPQRWVPAISMRGAFKGCKDFGAGNCAGGCRKASFRLRRCKNDQLWRFCTNPVDIGLGKTRLGCFGLQLAIGPHILNKAFRRGGSS